MGVELREEIGGWAAEVDLAVSLVPIMLNNGSFGKLPGGNAGIGIWAA